MSAKSEPLGAGERVYLHIYDYETKSGYLLLGYHSKPTLFQVNTVVAEAGIYFPDITICNYNPVYLSRLEKFRIQYVFKGLLLLTYLIR
ncbi:hypothetical protein RB195_017724 [Necator americanus]|uniref:Uncharacterized protein n=1 Tax=Necator americanus TaxID=51031 RepID=A0ABR1C6I8_NECAM